MPNWVTNTLTVTGDKADLDKFVEQVGRTHTRQFSRLENVDGKFVSITEDAEWTGEFTFWNIHAPHPSIMDEYNGVADGNAGPNNWYGWNVTNWGTKWDADVADVVRDGDNEWRVVFSTAWSPPYPVIATAAHQHPNLRFWLEWEEEQGFGAEVEFDTEGPNEVRTWDIPESHADFVDRDNEDGCVCAYEEDQQYWFADCPGKDDEWTAASIEDAAELAA